MEKIYSPKTPNYTFKHYAIISMSVGCGVTIAHSDFKVRELEVYPVRYAISAEVIARKPATYEYVCMGFIPKTVRVYIENSFEKVSKDQVSLRSMKHFDL